MEFEGIDLLLFLDGLMNEDFKNDDRITKILNRDSQKVMDEME